MAGWRSWLHRTLGNSTPEAAAPAPRKAVTASTAKPALNGIQNTPEHPPATAQTEPHAEVRRISYDPQLITSLKQDHVALLEIYGRIQQLHSASFYPETALELQRFKTALQAHVLTENVRFYAYVQSNLMRDSDDALLMHEFRREMNSIIRGVTDFLRRYEGQNGLTQQNHDSFLNDLGQVGALLQQRIDREERSLYPLYH